jgi:small-conductance mechanosensitive channel
MGFDTAPIVLVLLIAAVVVVLSGRALLENYGASLILQVRSPFEPGDQIQSGDYRGEVVEINGRTVVIATMDGKEVHIPNSTVVSNAIVNLTTRGRRRSRLDVGVEYGTDLGQARRVLTDTVTGVPGVLDDPAPEVFVTEFDDSAINFAVRYWHEPTIRDGFVVTDDVARAIDVALAAAGIVIAFPQATLWWGDAGSHDSEQTPT